MNPEHRIEFEAKEARHLRTIISVGLVLVLCGIVATYVYYGMQFARETAPSDMAVETVPMAPDAEVIFEALQNEPIASPETTMVIEAALIEATPTEAPDTEAMRRALGFPTE